MGRDHTKLRVFHFADSLIPKVYRATSKFPAEERYGLQTQIRRAAVSAATNIVEGCARRKTGEYLNFLSFANGSSAETRYLFEVASRLGFIAPTVQAEMTEGYTELMKGLQKLIASLENEP